MVHDGFYFGTTEPLTPGEPPALADPHALPVDGLERRAGAVAVAASLREATVIASVRFERELAATPALHLHFYRVEATPLHTGPVAVIEELRQRVADSPWHSRALIREYWSPSGLWHLQELLVSSFVVVEEVAPASDREIYVPRWVLYREDAERARLL